MQPKSWKNNVVFVGLEFIRRNLLVKTKLDLVSWQLERLAT